MYDQSQVCVLIDCLKTKIMEREQIRQLSQKKKKKKESLEFFVAVIKYVFSGDKPFESGVKVSLRVSRGKLFKFSPTRRKFCPKSS